MHQQLAPVGIASQADLDQRQAQAQVDEANVSVAQATIEAQQANIRRLTQLKAFARVTAPFVCACGLCATCRRVRDDQNYWSELSAYVSAHTDLRVTHGVCEDCLEQQAVEMGLTPAQVEALTQRFRRNRIT